MLRDRKKTRLQDYDYSKVGVYFVTVCVQNRETIFGNIKDNVMSLNKYGEIACKCWKELSWHYSRCELDEFIIMPNHIHGIININNYVVGNRHACSLQKDRQYQQLPIIIGSYKSAVSKIIHQTGCSEFQWQKSYYDRIVRNEKELYCIREYIQNNPIRWQEGREIFEKCVINIL